MKKAFVFVMAIMVFGLMSSFAQKPFAGTIKSKYIIEGNVDPNVRASLPDVMTTYVFENYTKNVMEMPGINIITITNGAKKTNYMIYDVTGMGKYYIETTEEEIKAAFANQETKFDYTGETKTVAGYTCEKVIETTVDKETDEETVVTLYVSKEICPNADINFGSHPGLVGYPLRTEVTKDINGENATVIIEAIEVKADKKVKLANFLLPADGKKVTQEELMRLFGAGDEDED